MEKKNPCIVMVPSPGLSHLIALVEFSKRLLSFQRENLHVKFIVPTLGAPSSSMKSILNNSLPPNSSFIILPQINIEDLTEKSDPATQMKETVKHSLPSSLKNSPHSVSPITLLLSCSVEFNLLTYLFFASGATLFSFCFHFPQLDQEADDSSKNSLLELIDPVHVLGCSVPFQVNDLPNPVLFERSSEVYKSFLAVVKNYSLVDGVINNTFTDLEPDAVKAWCEKNVPFVYPIGPIIQSETSNEVNKLECLTWLDNQPPRSVLYISFGSGGTLSQEQLNEIAFGLELSGYKFLWVVRAPSNFGGYVYLSQQKEDPLHYLPSGFVERTKGQGLILDHGSIGAFLSHCGWNSTLESVSHDMPVIAWPLFAEQRMNAVLLKDVLKVARIMEENEEELEMRKRIKELSDAVAAALSENGSSTKALSSLALKWQSI
ncbi:hypothetical protein AAHE18_12G042700 [Arachis hypogaea]